MCLKLPSNCGFFAVVFFVLSVLGIFFTGSAFAADQQLGADGYVKVFYCSQKILNRPVYWGFALNQKDFSAADIAQPPCSETNESLARWFADRQMTLIVEPSAAFVMPNYQRRPRGQENNLLTFSFNHFTIEYVTEKLETAETVENPDPPSPPQFEAIKKTVLSSVPMLPVNPGIRKGGDPDKAGFSIWFSAVTHRFKSGTGPLSAVVLMRSDAGDLRVIFGNLNGDKFDLLWSSLLVEQFLSPRIEFDDLDADGMEEIVLYGESEGGSARYPVLAAFNIEGKELTRLAKNCDAIYMAHRTWEERACPIEGREIKLWELPKGPTRIVVTGWAAAGWKGTTVFQLANGQYQPKVQPTGQKR